MSETIFYDLDFVNKRCEYEQVYTLRFSPRQPVPFKAGQWAHVGFDPQGLDKAREHNLSFASAPGDAYIEFSLDFATGTAYKQQLAALTPADSVKAFRINGKFVVNPSAPSPIVFLTGGIGITPVRSIIRDLQQRGVSLPWSLLHVARTEFLYRAELSLLNNPQWRVHHEGLDEVWPNILQQPDETRFYLSGSERFVSAMKERLMYEDIDSSQIFTESFL